MSLRVNNIVMKLTRAKIQLEKLERIVQVISDKYGEVLEPENIEAAKEILRREIDNLESQLIDN